jgi:uncharacterized sulfatase
MNSLMEMRLICFQHFVKLVEQFCPIIMKNIILFALFFATLSTLFSQEYNLEANINNVQDNTKSDTLKPNFVFILADDVTFSTLGCYGGQNAKTPNIDKLAMEGMQFSRAYCAMAMCAPFRAELYTGLYPVRNGVAWNHSFAKTGTKSIVHYLQDAGYRVGISGKRHASPLSVFPFQILKNFPAGEDIRSFMAQDKGEPFCLFICSRNAHAPWIEGDPTKFDSDKLKLPADLHDNPKMREAYTRYLAEVEDLDRETGDILALLEESGLSDNTIVMFSSEQGSPFGFAKWSNWDLGVHTGFIARWPGRIKAGVKSDAMIHIADVAPTFLEAAGAKVKAGQFDGRSFYPHLLGEEQTLRTYVYGCHNNVPEGNPYPIRSIRDKDYHYILNLTPDVSYHERHVMTLGKDSSNRLAWWPAIKEAEATGDTSAISLLNKYHHRPEVELYKVDEDPYENNNLANEPEYEAIKQRLHTELMKWMKSQKDPGVAIDNATVHAANKKEGKAEEKRGKKK